MSRPYPTARAFAEALAPAVKWSHSHGVWLVRCRTVRVVRDTKGRFVVLCGTGTICVGASRSGIQRARRWLLFMAGEDSKVAAFVEAAGLEQAP